MGTIASQITSLTIVYSTVYSDAHQRKHQSCASLAFVRGIHRWPVNSPHKWPVTCQCFHLMTSSWAQVHFLPMFIAKILSFERKIVTPERLIKWLVSAMTKRFVTRGLIFCDLELKLRSVLCIQAADGPENVLNTSPLDKMAVIAHTIVSYAFSWMKCFVLNFSLSLFLRVLLSITQHWFRLWLGTE